MALQFKKCKTCGRIFQSVTGLECPDCIDEREEKFTRVKEYLYEEPGASLDMIVEETGVDSKLVIRFLKEGRLEMTNSEGLLKCEKCGASITSGTMCNACKDKLSRAMERVLPKQAAATNPSPASASGKDKLHVTVRGR